MLDQNWLNEMRKKLESDRMGLFNDWKWVFMPKNPGSRLIVRPIPYKGRLAKEVIKHYKPSGGSLNCLINWGRNCPLCEVTFGSNDNTIKRMAATKRYYYNVYVRKHSENEELAGVIGIMISPVSVFRDIMRYFLDEDYIIPNLLDPKEGYDIIIEKLPDNKYKVEASRKSEPVIYKGKEINSWNELNNEIKDLDILIPEWNDAFENKIREVANRLGGLNFSRNGTTETKPNHGEVVNRPTPVNNNNKPSYSEEHNDKPPCFGKHDGSDKCIKCPFEVSCVLGS